MLRNKVTINFLVKTIFIMSLTTLLTVLAQAAPVAAETPKGAHQPYMYGYNAEQLKNWSPETDRYAKYFRSRIPIAERIPAFSATQANPLLSTEPQVMNLSADYDKDEVFDSFRYNDAFSRNLLNFWQYTDIYGSWHGLPVDGSLMGKPSFGVINLPNPAYTDAAHRNGVISLGGWFWPRAGQNFADWVEQKEDGTFPVADKMIEMAQYFGFDGYFINQEAKISSEHAAKLMDMLKYMRATAPEGFHIQWYDSLKTSGSISYQNEFNSTNAPWIIDKGVPVSHSIFLNYWWKDSRLKNSNAYAKSLGLDPYKVVFAGTENDMYGYNTPYDPRLIFPQDEAPRTSWALFGTDFVWNHAPHKFKTEAQEEVFRRERVYWSGPNEDPTNTGRTNTSNCTKQDYRCWDGVAHYIPARSVIGSFPFVTSFSTGHGTSFFVKGEKSSSKEWNNAGIQDLLPSWQWWVKSEGSGKPLTPAFDYSTAYDGGSSLKIAGNLDANNSTILRLFKTKLLVTDDVNLSITYKSDDGNKPTLMKAALLFEDQPDQFEYIDIGNSTNAGWNKQILNLDAYKGRTIATIGLRFESAESTEYVMHIGELALTQGAATAPHTPDNFKIDRAYFKQTSAELFLSWQLEPTGLKHYDLYRIKPDGAKEAIGRIFDDVYYVKELDRIGTEEEITIELVAVGADGSQSPAAAATLEWGEPDPDSGTPVDPNLPTAITTLRTYLDNTPDRMIDGNPDTYFWSNHVPSIGDVVGIDLKKVSTISQVQVLMAKSGNDFIHKGILEYSADGENWTAIAELNGQREIDITVEDQLARYIRIRTTGEQTNWVIVREFSVTHTPIEPLVPAVKWSDDKIIEQDHEFTVQLSVISAGQPLYAQDILVEYDASLMEFMSAKSLLDGVTLLETKKDAPGKLRFIMASQGADNAITEETVLLALTYKAKQVTQATESFVKAQGTLADQLGAEYETEAASMIIQINPAPPKVFEDVNVDGKVSIGDLAIVASHYGKTKDSPDWEQAKIADINRDNKIDILDLTAIAIKIFEESE